jgi:hypothetical protein
VCTRDTHNIIKFDDDDDCLRTPRPIINELSEFISIITKWTLLVLETLSDGATPHAVLF